MLSRFTFSNKSMQFLCLYFYQKTFLQVLQVLSKSRVAPTILEKNQRSFKASFGDSYCSPLPIIQMECVIMVPDLRYNVKITVNIKLLVPSHYMTVTGNWQTHRCLHFLSSSLTEKESIYCINSR